MVLTVREKSEDQEMSVNFAFQSQGKVKVPGCKS